MIISLKNVTQKKCWNEATCMDFDVSNIKRAGRYFKLKEIN